MTRETVSGTLWVPPPPIYFDVLIVGDPATGLTGVAESKSISVDRF